MAHVSTLFLYFIMSISLAQTNFDENLVPQFELPDPLTTFGGKSIHTAQDWTDIRRPELLRFFTDQVYGEVPKEIAIASSTVLEQDNNALEGKALRQQIELVFKDGHQSLNITLLLYLPKNSSNAPIFLGYNFYGNHTVTNDPAVLIASAWARNNTDLGISNNKLTAASRGAYTGRWPLEKIIGAGYGLATLYYGEVDPDKNDFSDGPHALTYSPGQTAPKDNEWGSIAAWAWGMRKVLDFLEKNKGTTNSKVIAFGHSRLGKAALWAGANDTRFAGVVSNNSGCGGAALSKREFGETIAAINRNFPHWFCNNFKKYDHNEEALEVDQHQLLALIAPRPLYVASAVEDRWADPKGEFLSAYHTGPVYELFGKTAIASQEMPKNNTPIHNTVAYHIRTGKHDVTDYDWEQYLKWANDFVIGDQ
ncbi:MAG TPA: hypothetical protein VLZ54_11290 [Arenibacter sp.]|nr:hypothetical protein [Arenibacter sp.]